MGVSENSVPLNPMVLLIIIPFLNGYLIGNIPNIFRQTYMENDDPPVRDPGTPYESTLAPVTPVVRLFKPDSMTFFGIPQNSHREEHYEINGRC